MDLATSKENVAKEKVYWVNGTIAFAWALFIFYNPLVFIANIFQIELH